MVVIVANNIENGFPKEKTLIWKISDIDQNNIKGIKRRVSIIKKECFEFSLKTEKEQEIRIFKN